MKQTKLNFKVNGSPKKGKKKGSSSSDDDINSDFESQSTPSPTKERILSRRAATKPIKYNLDDSSPSSASDNEPELYDNDAVKDVSMRQEKIVEDSDSDDDFPKPKANVSMESSEDMFDELIRRGREAKERSPEPSKPQSIEVQKEKPTEPPKKKAPAKRKRPDKEKSPISDDDMFTNGDKKNKMFDSDSDADFLAEEKKATKKPAARKKKKADSDDDFGLKEKKGKKKKKADSSEDEFSPKEAKGKKKKKKADDSDEDFFGKSADDAKSDSGGEEESTLMKPNRSGRAAKPSKYVFDDSDDSY